MLLDHHRPEKETIAGEHFHSVLREWKMALPATFQPDPPGAGTWQSNARTRKRFDVVCTDPYMVATRPICWSRSSNTSGLELTHRPFVDTIHYPHATGSVGTFGQQEQSDLSSILGRISRCGYASGLCRGAVPAHVGRSISMTICCLNCSGALGFGML